jgi:hypothetical protein
MRHKSINEVYNQLSSVVNNTYATIGKDILIPTKHGIVVYNTYLIRKTTTDFEIASRTNSEVITFGSARNALVWAILNHHCKIYESKRVRELDILIHGIDIDLKIHTKLKSKGSTENYLIQSSKLQRDKERQRQFLYEIDKYIILAQKCQQTRTNK